MRTVAAAIEVNTRTATSMAGMLIAMPAVNATSVVGIAGPMRRALFVTGNMQIKLSRDERAGAIRVTIKLMRVALSSAPEAAV
ncbi:hypothetical protein EDF64_10838 [Curtobacterium flaccumfaciens]|uniref:Uncharacterized protein n=1 Tax=Curtobacterium flaccumfaciens TaxID=2035 RepID=A0A4R6DH46_9MICO|nr:hypothetical protein EDF64_10838 [Curtobacterium flaccumfaciens]